ncbi:Rne/Rng family ribonuclease [Paracoccus alkenifer]|uniref:Ribonuclease E n=1 Tax=Paracoccus alkenifer TaxID=65735 RepID=A0A1H6MA99_9RHOB|nr:ribonuclease E/G [Paracoccus alkenifer]SEH94982.1 ribonuclease E [Paracoccus alkenifer]
MAKKMLIDATHPEETRVVVADGTKVEDFDFETLNKRQLAGNIYLAKVTRVEPSLQAAFVDYGGNRHGFLAFAEIHPDYYQIPAADRAALIEEDRAAAAEAEADEGAQERRSSRSRGRGRNGSRDGSRDGARGDERAERAVQDDAVTRSDAVPGMEIIDAAPAEETAAAEDTAADTQVAAPENTETGAAEIAAAASAQAAPEAAGSADETDADDHGDDHGDSDDDIESIAEEDVAEEIRPSRKPRARRYKIQEVIKVRQIMLVQVVKEERGNKGAALTTYLSLAGRYCVLMPNTARGGGISRKITNVADRKKLKDIASDLEVPSGAGLIIRTAGSQRTRSEIKRDYEYLMRLWEQIRERTFKSMAPAPIYEEGDLIKRTIRDLYSKEIDEVLVEGERGWRTARDFMAMIMPTHARSVKHYTDPTPLFARYQVESYLAGMFNPVVQLKSGGYIVIGITEALVAIDVNSGRATKEGSIEETATKTNLEAADEIARQLRLRDLAGLIVVDFIDMDERKNNAAVEKRFKDALKNDRARIQVGRISGFGLMEMSRQRLRPGMLESTTQPCAHCHGTGLIRSDDSMALTILRAIEEEGTRKRSREVLVKVPVAVANYLMNQKRDHIARIEARYGLSVRIEADPGLISPDYSLEKFKTATRAIPDHSSAALSVDASLMAEIDESDNSSEDEALDAENLATPDDGNGDDAASPTRRRRRRRRRNGDESSDEDHAAQSGGDDDSDADQDDAADASEAGAADADEAAAEKPATGRSRRSRSRSRSRRSSEDQQSGDGPAVIDESRDAPAGQGAPVETGGIPANADGLGDDLLGGSPGDDAADLAQPGAAEQVAEPVAEAESGAEGEPGEAADETAADAKAGTAAAETPATARPEPEPEPEAEPAAAEPAPIRAEQPRELAQPKRRGWWSAG